MDLERIVINLRSRRGWESADLGIALIRSMARPIYGRWLLVAAPPAIALITLLPSWGWLIFWWLMPLWEAPALYTLSRAVFGEIPLLKTTLRALPGLWRRALPELGLRRLGPRRISNLPISQLEGLGGKARRQRATVLITNQDTAGLLPLTFVLFELGSLMSLIALATFLTPSWAGFDWSLVAEQFFTGALPTAYYVAFQLLAAAVLLLLHPLYLGAGFAVYLNRRTQLEGWDLEIAFRRLATRLEATGFARKVKDEAEWAADEAAESGDAVDGGPAGDVAEDAPAAEEVESPGTEGEPAGESTAEPATATPRLEDTSPNAGSGPSRPGLPGAGALLLVLLLAAFGGEPAGGQEPSPEPASEAAEAADPGAREPDSEESGADPEEIPPAAWSGDPARDPRKVVQQIYELPELQRQETVRRWRWRDRERDVDLPDGPDFSRFFTSLAAFFGAVFEPVMWTLLALAVLFLLWTAWKNLPDEAPSVLDEPLPERIAGLDLRAESLPADIPGEARSLWGEGRIAEALSLLYRGALARLVAGGLELRESFTENDCLRVARAALPADRATYFAELTGAWQSVAYAHRAPGDDHAERLWSTWGDHFGGTA